MEQPRWHYANDAGDMKFVLLQSSEGRFWTGLDAMIDDTSAGSMVLPARGYHTLELLIGTPTKARYHVDGKMHRRFQTPGDIDFIPAGCPRTWDADGPTRILSLHLHPSLMRHAAEALRINPDTMSLEPRLQLRDPRIEYIGLALIDELNQEDSNDRLFADSLGVALASHVVRRYARRDADVRVARGFSKRSLARVMDYIQANISQNITLFELAELAHISPSHFKLLFKHSVGMPVHQYVVRKRVDYAIELILAAKLPLSQIALAAGFANQSHMARCVRKVTGMAPAVFKRQIV